MYTAGIDIGGTQLRAALFDDEHRMAASFKTANDRAHTAEQNMEALIAFLNGRSEDLRGVGIGCPGPLDLRAGRMRNPPNLVGWDGFEIVRFVEERTGLRAKLNNDANCAGLAEALLGAGRGRESVAYIGVSTGIGGAFVQEGRLLNGAHGNAAEFWNMIVNEDTRSHKNANPGSLNEQASGSGLERGAELAFSRKLRARELFALAAKGDSTARAVIERGADALARGIANICCILDPEAIVIGGSVAIHNPGYVDRAVELAKGYCLDPEALTVLPAAFGDDAGLLGASLLV